jgi:hypothetical protein
MPFASLPRNLFSHGVIALKQGELDGRIENKEK